MRISAFDDYVVLTPYKIKGDSFYSGTLSGEVMVGQNHDLDILLFLSENSKKFVIDGKEFISVPRKDLIAIVEE
jgi:hypothetical protein